MLVRAMGYGTIAGLAQDLPMPFRDVTTNVGYIAMAHELGLVNGTAATTFSPDQTATREQAAVMLIRLYDSYHAAAPEKTGIAYSAEGLTDLTGYGAVAVGGRPADLRRGVPARRYPRCRDRSRPAGDHHRRRCRAAAACGRERLGTEG